MGTNNYQTKNPGDVISHEDPNQYKIGLTGDVVPRNSSGVPTDIFGSLGSTIYRWLRGHFESVFIGATASGIALKDDSGNLEVEVDGATVLTVEPTGLVGTGLKDDSMPFSKLSPVRGEEIATVSGGTFNTSTSFVTVANVTVTITTRGRPVFVGITAKQNSNSFLGSYYPSPNNGTNPEARFQILRGATVIASWRLELEVATSQSPLFLLVPASLFTVDDNDGAGLAAGTYTYTFQQRSVTGGNNVAQTDGLRMIAYEL